MIVVTGGAGFIGSNVLVELNRQNLQDIVVVDDLSDGSKFTNLVDATYADFQDKDEFRHALNSKTREYADVECVIHLGACSDTTEWDGKYMMDTNYAYSKDVLAYCLEHEIRLVYASSAAVYGLNRDFKEVAANEKPLNVYGYSKLMFDNYVRRLPEQQRAHIVGLRYFNVYGPREAHKNKMASVVYHFEQQLKQENQVRLFGASHGCGDGAHERDFVSVDDAVAVTLWMARQVGLGGIFNCGTGQTATFNEVAESVIGYHGGGSIEYIDMPASLHKAYQSYTCADLENLREVGCDVGFLHVTEGIRRYLDWLKAGKT